MRIGSTTSLHDFKWIARTDYKGKPVIHLMCPCDDHAWEILYSAYELTPQEAKRMINFYNSDYPDNEWAW